MNSSPFFDNFLRIYFKLCIFFFSFKKKIFLPTQVKKHVHKILVLSYNLFHFPEDWRRTCPDTRNLLFLCSKEFHNKFATVLMICERWSHSEKTKTGIAFDAEMIFTCRLFQKSYIFIFFWAQYRFKKNQNKEKKPLK